MLGNYPTVSGRPLRGNIVLRFLEQCEGVLQSYISVPTLVFLYYFIGTHIEFLYKLQTIEQGGTKSSRYFSLQILSFLFINPSQAAIGVLTKRIKKLILQNSSDYVIYTLIRDVLLFLFAVTISTVSIFFLVNMLFYGNPLGATATLFGGYEAVSVKEYWEACYGKGLKVFYQPFVGICSTMHRSIYVGIEKIGAPSIRVILGRWIKNKLWVDSISYMFNFLVVLIGCWDLILNGWYEEQREIRRGNLSTRGYFRNATLIKRDKEFYQDLFDGMISKAQLTFYYSIEIIYINIMYSQNDQVAMGNLAFATSAHFLTDIYIGVGYPLVPFLIGVKEKNQSVFWNFWMMMLVPLSIGNITIFAEAFYKSFYEKSLYFNLVPCPTLIVLVSSMVRGIISTFGGLSIVLGGSTRYLSILQVFSTILLVVILLIARPSIEDYFYYVFAAQIITLVLGSTVLYVMSNNLERRK